MTHVKTLISTLSAIFVVAMGVSFLIVYRVAPQAAWACFFVDIGALIALLGTCLSLPKSPPLKTDEISEGLRDLARGRYDRRLVYRDFGSLSDVAQAFNELAGTLADNADPALVRIRNARLAKPEPVVKRPVLPEQHSHHPELGQVQAFPVKHSNRDLYEQFKEAHKAQNKEVVAFEAFEQTLHKATQDLMREHQVKSVRFEVVLESGEVALRPRLLR